MWWFLGHTVRSVRLRDRYSHLEVKLPLSHAHGFGLHLQSKAIRQVISVAVVSLSWRLVDETELNEESMIVADKDDYYFSFLLEIS